MSLYFYRAEPYTGHSSELAAHLAPLGIKLWRPAGYMPCTEFLEEGQWLREVGYLNWYPQRGLIDAVPCSDATDKDRVLLPRTCERALLGTFDAPWREMQSKVHGDPRREVAINRRLDSRGAATAQLTSSDRGPIRWAKVEAKKGIFERLDELTPTL